MLILKSTKIKKKKSLVLAPRFQKKPFNHYKSQIQGDRKQQQYETNGRPARLQPD